MKIMRLDDDDDDKARAISVSLTGSGRVGSGPVESGRVGSAGHGESTFHLIWGWLVAIG